MVFALSRGSWVERLLRRACDRRWLARCCDDSYQAHLFDCGLTRTKSLRRDHGSTAPLGSYGDILARPSTQSGEADDGGQPSMPMTWSAGESIRSRSQRYAPRAILMAYRSAGESIRFRSQRYAPLMFA